MPDTTDTSKTLLEQGLLSYLVTTHQAELIFDNVIMEGIKIEADYL
jgi:hypothetical protein